jgi:hypothetical protein
MSRTILVVETMLPWERPGRCGRSLEFPLVVAEAVGRYAALVVARQVRLAPILLDIQLPRRPALESLLG